jgi:tetratricopeptide (TPR) repeat protein
MTKRAVLRLAIALFAGAAGAVAGFADALAADPLGTAGPFRSVGWGRCEAGVQAQFSGACDPAPVDPDLPAAERSQAHFERAIRLLSLVRMEQARQAVDAAIAADPNNVQARKLRARMNIPGNGDVALADINAGLLLAPTDSDLLATRAMLMCGRCDKAGPLHDANEAVRQNGRNTDALWIRARILAELGQLPAADDDLTRALEIEPDYARARLLRAQFRMRLGRLKEAAEDADRVIGGGGGNGGGASALQVRALARAGLGDWSGAVADLTAILGAPGAPTTASPRMAFFNELYIQRAIALVHLGRESEAMRDFETVIGLGGRPAILRMQVYLRGNGFPDVPLDGQRSQALDDAVKACFVNDACGRGIAQRI